MSSPQNLLVNKYVGGIRPPPSNRTKYLTWSVLKDYLVDGS